MSYLYQRKQYKMFPTENNVEGNKTIINQKLNEVSILNLFLRYVSGKTTLADCLVASNGIISNRLAGKVSILKDHCQSL